MTSIALSLALSLFSSQTPPSCDCTAQRCLSGDPRVEVSGTVETITGHDANGRALTGLALRSSKPFCALMASVEDDVARPVVSEVLHLIPPKGVTLRASQRLTLTGTVRLGLTAHHLAPLLLDVEKSQQ
jgi:hypothetical protein